MEVPRVKTPTVAIQRCTSSWKSEMPLHIAGRIKVSKNIARLQDLARQILNDIQYNKISRDDVQFFKLVYNGGPEYNDWNTKVARETGKTPDAKTNVTLYPMIDMNSSHPDTIQTALCEAMRVTVRARQKLTVFTNDQQLYKVAVQLTWSETQLFQNIVPRLGGMDFLMSFVGTVGTLMP